MEADTDTTIAIIMIVNNATTTGVIVSVATSMQASISKLLLDKNVVANNAAMDV